MLQDGFWWADRCFTLANGEDIGDAAFAEADEKQVFKWVEGWTNLIGARAIRLERLRQMEAPESLIDDANTTLRQGIDLAMPFVERLQEIRDARHAFEEREARRVAGDMRRLADLIVANGGCIETDKATQMRRLLASIEGDCLFEADAPDPEE